jgi:hypothetical protein
MITIQREPHPVEQDEALKRFECTFCSYPIYTSNHGLAMLEIRRGKGTSEMWRSEDNGRTWARTDAIPAEEDRGDGTFAQWTLGPFVHDTRRDVLLRFEWHRLFREPPGGLRGYHDFLRANIPHSYRAWYRVSRDGGRTWGERIPLIEDGDEFDAVHWARGVTFLEGAAVVAEVPPYLTLPDGRLMLPFHGYSSLERETLGTIQAGRFFGAWDERGERLRWRTGGFVPGGGCEQTIVELRDGRLWNILRAQGQIEPYPFANWQRPWSVSADRGETWSQPRPLEWDDGGGLTTPRAWSQLVRSEHNGRLYWIANILPALEDSADIRRQWPGRADPRYPLRIAEVDEDRLVLKRDTLTVIEDRAPGETPFVRFSNFYVYNDRESGEIVLLMMKSYHEDQPNLGRMPHPAYRYRIRVSD